MGFFSATWRKKGEKRDNLTLASGTVRTACFCLEPRAEIRACITCSDAFMVNCKSSFFLDQVAHTAMRDAEQTKEEDWVLDPEEHLEERRPIKAEIGKYWKCIRAMMKGQLPLHKKQEGPSSSWAVICDLVSPTTSVRHAEIHQRTDTLWMQTVWPHLCPHPRMASAHSFMNQHYCCWSP